MFPVVPDEHLSGANARSRDDTGRKRRGGDTRRVSEGLLLGVMQCIWADISRKVTSL
ncbi:hypothetical protein SKAU_G00240100 [Synaphobranchus kaupii]|uniref:Uncharacterized protein n=1 Tax=Synaphobranchus kaupii TaxID=118154 RepID=A0A9Q1F7E0_SYNKA|nr:hypothetical protein SKAU_G00240100 [Synaphobranchus kaupii]